MIILLLIFSFNLHADDLKCEAGKILVRSQYVTNYTRKDGTKVSGYYKKQYCRLSQHKVAISFLNEKPEYWPLEEKFKEWSEKDIETILEVIENLPDIFKRQVVKSFHRGTVSNFPKNPAATLALNQTIILYDDFFKSKIKTRVLAHELAHLWYWELSKEKKMGFAVQAGWTYDHQTRTRAKSKKSIYPDSQNGPGEDFANNAEAFFYDKNYQKIFDAQLQKYFMNLIEEKK